MTLLQALSNASKSGLRVSHPLIQGGALITLKDLETMSVPVAVAAGNEWELEARNVHINEFSAKERMIPVLRRYISGGKIDELAEAIVAEFFTELL